MWRVVFLFLLSSFFLSAIESDEEFFDNRSVEEQSSDKAKALRNKAHYLTPIINYNDFRKDLRLAIKKNYNLLYISSENTEFISDMLLDNKLSPLYQIQIINNRKIEGQGFDQAIWDFHLLQKDFKKYGLKKTLKNPQKKKILYEIQKRSPSHLSARQLYLYTVKKHKKTYSYVTAVQKIFSLSLKLGKFTSNYKYKRNKTKKKINSYLRKFTTLKKNAPRSVKKLLKSHLEYCQSLLNIDKLNKDQAKYKKRVEGLKSIKNRNEYNRAVDDINSNVKSINKKINKYYKELNRTIRNVNTMLKHHNKKITNRFKS